MSEFAPPCRSCGTGLVHTFIDLGTTPLANAFLGEADLARPEPRLPLHARVCHGCFLVQVEAVVPPEEIFSHYAYFSSYSPSWVEHGRRFAESAMARFGLGAGSLVIEVASNDGYLLRHFIDRGVAALGIEPASNVAEVARASGVPTETRFFGRQTAVDLLARGLPADLVVANNVLAHVPDLNDFVAGLALLVESGGVVSCEFPHLMRLIDEVQFDTIYHEHLSYFSFLAVEAVFSRHGLRVFDVEQLSTHGGSLRVFACRGDDAQRQVSPSVASLRAAERASRLDQLEAFAGFAERVAQVKTGLLEFLRGARREGRTVVAYGAAAKGNTLLNTCGIGRDLIAYAVDRSPHKQGLYLPGSRLPIRAPECIFESRPDYVLILPWNLQDEIAAMMGGIREWGGQFVVPIPEIKLLR